MVAPMVTVNQKAGQVDPTSALPVLWTVTFSEPVTGFDASDLTRTARRVAARWLWRAAGRAMRSRLGNPSMGTSAFTIAAGRTPDAAGNDNAAIDEHPTTP